MEEISNNLRSLKMPGMAHFWTTLHETRRCEELSLRDGLALMIQAELDSRTMSRNARLLKKARFRYQASIDQVLFDSSRGVDKQKLLKTFMNIRFYGNLYYTKSEFQFRDEEQPYTAENLGYSFRLNFWAKLWKFLEVNAAANYQSQNVFFFSTVKPTYSIDLGLRAEFWKRRIAVWVNVDDLFDWGRSATVNDSPYYSYSDSTRVSYRARTVRFGLSFKFGKMELEGSQAGQQAIGNRGEEVVSS